MSDQKRILFLYTELANYFLVCVRELVKQSGAQVHIVRWPLNSEAPFEFDLGQENIFIYDRKQYNHAELAELVNKINPHLIYCSGWIDKGYVSVCRQWKKKINVVAGIDTQWNGSFKQQLNCLLSSFTVKPNFSHIWVAGDPQKLYARKLGYANDKILTGVYSADVNGFARLYRQFGQQKEKEFPQRFIYVGRYLEFKGIFDLWDAFLQTLNEESHEWELWCLGTGDAWEQRVQHERIRHLGFVQPHNMDEIIGQTGVFVLPSRFEPWAVAVHEFAAAGFPLICSSQVGAATRFLQHGHNGFVFGAGKVSELKQAMLKCIRTDSLTLNKMGHRSHELALELTPLTWSQQLLSLL